MKIDLSGRTAIVCGASQGIGEATARSLAAAGARVVLFARNAAAIEAHARELGGVAVPGDLLSEADLQRLLEVATADGHGLDILVHNGGGPSSATASELAEDALDDAFELVVRPVMRLTRLALPALTASGHGRIVVIGSPTFREVQDGRVLSNMLRPAVVGWAATLAREVGSSGTTVNTIAPGRIETPSFAEYYATRSKEDDLAAIPLGRFGTPGEIGDLVTFLASDVAAYITGTVITIDGGLMRAI